jgi:hypothetical protein
MIKCDPQKLFKYGLYIAIIYALLTIIPSQKLKSNDMILIISSLLIIIVLLDNVNNEGFVNITDENTIPLVVGSSSGNTFTSYAQLADSLYSNYNTSPAQATSTSTGQASQANSSVGQTGSAAATNSALGVGQVTGANQTGQVTAGQVTGQTGQVTGQTGQVTGANTDADKENISKSMCNLQLDQIKKDFEQQIENLKSELTINSTGGSQSSTVKYYKQLIKELSNNGILDAVDVKNITVKLNSKLITIDEAVASLEKVKEQGVIKERNVNSDFIYSELPSEFYTPLGKRIVSDWENEYNLLDSTNWQVPMQRPPVCITSEKCKVCPKETYPGTTLLKDWDSSRKISDIKVNKKWASNN